MCASILPVGLLFYAALSSSPEATRITEAGGDIRAVSVQKVLSSEYVRKKNTHHYTVMARVSVPFDAGTRPVEAEFNSDSRVEHGDKVWALFSPSSAGLGVLVESDREVLEEKMGGPAQWGIQVFVLSMAVFCLLVGILFGGFTKVSRGLRGALTSGRCRSLPVTVGGVDVALYRNPPKEDTPRQVKPRLKLEAYEGQRLEVLLDPVVDPLPLSQEVTGRQAQLYWRAFRPDERPGTRHASAMVVLDGQRCVRGRLGAVGGADLPEGVPVPVSDDLPEGDGLRAIRTLPAWDPKFHTPGLWTLLVGVFALGIVAFGVGRLVALILCAVAFLAPAVARGWVKSRRNRYLQGFLPASDPEISR
ncbi:hypothetical protein XF35_03855 [Streptomyces platensis subsp. clarensis]|nr:hypothetical protein [Streptomyces platensis subsp. clarensis]